MKASTVAAVAVLLVSAIGITAGATFLAFPNNLTTTTTVYTAVSTTSTTESFTTPSTALVFGLVSATGNDTFLAEFIFTSLSSGAVFTIPIANGHSFSVRLPNPDSLNATAVWVGKYYWQRGEVYIGQVITNWGPGSTDAQSFNQVVETPNSMINVSGMANTSAQLRPLTVRFVSTNGLVAEFPAASNGSYFGQLPNMMNYSASIKVQYTNGTAAYCDAGTAELNEGAGVSNATLAIAC